MRDIPVLLAAALASGITTHCHCWKLTRLDGQILGFTDHDRDIMIGNALFEAASGLDASTSEIERGLATGGGEVSGVLSSARILPGEIEAGLFDGAELRRWLVDWQNPVLDFLLDVATLGEIRSMDGRFSAETRNAFHALDQERGRLYGAGCSARLGDARCRVNLDLPAWKGQGLVAATDGTKTLRVPGLANQLPGHFTHGILSFTGGANAGLSIPVKEYRVDGEIILWRALLREIAVGDAISVTAGCDKRFETCRTRFQNAINFRGFPFIPAPDFVIAYAQPGEGNHAGRPLVR